MARGLDLPYGGLERAELLAELARAHVHTNEHADWLLARPEFTNPPPGRATIAFVSAGELHPAGPTSFQRLMHAARDAGYHQPALTCAPWLRLALLDQDDAADGVLSAGRAPNGAITVASKPVSSDDELPKGFYLRRVEGTLWLRGHRFTEEYLFPAETMFALATEFPESQSSNEDDQGSALPR